MSERLLRGPRAHADCRLTCSEGCESWDSIDHEHELVDYGKCLFVEWMEEGDGVLDAHRGSHAPTDGFIEIEWDDGYYTWSYADAP